MIIDFNRFTTNRKRQTNSHCIQSYTMKATKKHFCIKFHRNLWVFVTFQAFVFLHLQLKCNTPYILACDYAPPPPLPLLRLIKKPLIAEEVYKIQPFGSVPKRHGQLFNWRLNNKTSPLTRPCIKQTLTARKVQRPVRQIKKEAFTLAVNRDDNDWLHFNKRIWS